VLHDARSLWLCDLLPCRTTMAWRISREAQSARTVADAVQSADRLCHLRVAYTRWRKVSSTRHAIAIPRAKLAITPEIYRWAPVAAFPRLPTPRYSLQAWFRAVLTRLAGAYRAGITTWDAYLRWHRYTAAMASWSAWARVGTKAHLTGTKGIPLYRPLLNVLGPRARRRHSSP